MSDLKKSPIVVLLLANLAFSSFIAINMFKQQNAHTEPNTLNQSASVDQQNAKVPSTASTSTSGSSGEAKTSGNTAKTAFTDSATQSKTFASSVHRNSSLAKNIASSDEFAPSKVATKLRKQPNNDVATKSVYHDPAEPSSEDINAVLAMASQSSAHSVKSTKTLRPVVSDMVPSSRPIRMTIPPPPSNSIFNGAQSLSKMDGITVTAVMGNKAMLKLEKPSRRHHHEVPEVVCLAVGEHIRTPYNVSVAIVAVEPYRVTLDIDGDRFVKSLTEIR
jgi:hypothetical protein